MASGDCSAMAGGWDASAMAVLAGGCCGICGPLLADVVAVVKFVGEAKAAKGCDGDGIEAGAIVEMPAGAAAALSDGRSASSDPFGEGTSRASDMVAVMSVVEAVTSAVLLGAGEAVA